MKQSIFTILFFSAISLISCKKNTLQLTINQSDQQQIQNYIAANHLTGYVRDTIGGDTTGMYYKIFLHGAGPALAYTDKIAFVFSLNTLDGKYVSADTIDNHFFDYVGHISTSKLPLGLQTAVINDLKYQGGSMHVLIPSHLAYGTAGFSTTGGSTQVANSTISGNESLDYYIHIIGNTPTDNQATYDDMLIQNYMKANNLTGYTKTASGLYYSILTPGTGTTDPITDNSTISCTYTGQELDGIIFDGSHNGVNSATFAVNSLVPGVVEGLENYAVAGTKISLLIPSALGYGGTATPGVAINSCLRFTFQVITVTP